MCLHDYLEDGMNKVFLLANCMQEKKSKDMFYCMSQAQDPSPDTVTSFGQHHLFRYSGCSPRITVIMFSAALNLLRSPLSLCSLYMYVCFMYGCMYIYLVTWNLSELDFHRCPLFFLIFIIVFYQVDYF